MADLDKAIADLRAMCDKPSGEYADWYWQEKAERLLAALDAARGQAVAWRYRRSTAESWNRPDEDRGCLVGDGDEWSPLYAAPPAAADDEIMAGDCCDQAYRDGREYESKRSERLAAQLHDLSQRHDALIKMVSDGRAMQPPAPILVQAPPAADRDFIDSLGDCLFHASHLLHNGREGAAAEAIQEAIAMLAAAQGDRNAK